MTDLITLAPLDSPAAKFTEMQARDWLAANPTDARTVRDLAELWGWHRSSVQRFLSRIRAETSEKNGETKALSRETGETSKTNAPAPAAAADEPENFDWSPENGDVIVPSQQELAIYINPYRQVVIRARSDWSDDDDTFICVSPEHVPKLIAKLRAVLEEITHGS